MSGTRPYTKHALDLLERRDDTDCRGFGERLASRIYTRERVGGLAHDGLGSLTTERGLQCAPRVAVGS